MTDADADRLWDEYKYRHEHTWNAVFKLTLAVLAISVLPYAQETVVCVVGKPIIGLPVVAVLLNLFGVLVIWRELRILESVRDRHRYNQGTSGLGRDWFRTLVISYLVALTVAASLNFMFVRIWQRAISSAHSGNQCFESPKEG